MEIIIIAIFLWLYYNQIRIQKIGFGVVKNPYLLGAKASLTWCFGVFCTVIIPDIYGRGAVGYKIQITGKPQNHLADMIFELPDRSVSWAVLDYQKGTKNAYICRCANV